MNKENRIQQYETTVKAIKIVIKRYNELLHSTIIIDKCPLCIPFSKTNKLHFLKVHCPQCPNQTFSPIKYNLSCPAYRRPNSKCVTTTFYTNTQRAKAIGFWVNVLLMFEQNKEQIIDRMMRGNRTYKQHTKLSKMIRVCDMNMNDELIKSYDSRKKYTHNIKPN